MTHPHPSNVLQKSPEVSEENHSLELTSGMTKRVQDIINSSESYAALTSKMMDMTRTHFPNKEWYTSVEIAAATLITVYGANNLISEDLFVLNAHINTRMAALARSNKALVVRHIDKVLTTMVSKTICNLAGVGHGRYTSGYKRWADATPGERIMSRKGVINNVSKYASKKNSREQMALDMALKWKSKKRKIIADPKDEHSAFRQGLGVKAPLEDTMVIKPVKSIDQYVASLSFEECTEVVLAAMSRQADLHETVAKDVSAVKKHIEAIKNIHLV